MRFLSVVVGAAITVSCVYALLHMPWSVVTRCEAAGPEAARCEVTVGSPLGEEVRALGPGKLEARAAPAGEGDKAFRPELVVGADRFGLPLLVDTHLQAMGIAKKHATVGPPVPMEIARGRHLLVGGFAILGLVLVLSSLRRRPR